MSNQIEDAKNIVAGCFGSVDYLFAGHHMDEDRAKKLRKLIKDGVYNWNDIGIAS